MYVSAKVSFRRLQVVDCELPGRPVQNRQSSKQLGPKNLPKLDLDYFRPRDQIDQVSLRKRILRK